MEHIIKNFPMIGFFMKLSATIQFHGKYVQGRNIWSGETPQYKRNMKLNGIPDT